MIIFFVIFLISITGRVENTHNVFDWSTECQISSTCLGILEFLYLFLNDKSRSLNQVPNYPMILQYVYSYDICILEP